MKERPILFSGAMVRAILSGRKTQTRRVVKPQPTRLEWFDHQKGWLGSFGEDAGSRDNPHRMVPCPYGVPGDRLWVKETHYNNSVGNVIAQMFKAKEQPKVYYRADHEGVVTWNWKPSIFMKRQLSRITLEIVSVRVERLQDISEVDAMAEGIHRFEVNDCTYFHSRPTAPTEEHFNSGLMAYRDLWESINGAGSWDANPWVWVVEFKRL